MEKLSLRLRTRYHVECRDAQGNFKWEDDFHNLVTTEGMNTVLDYAFKGGKTTPAWFIGLVDGTQEPSFAAADTMILHGGWIENIGYDEGERQPFVPGAIADGTVDNVDSRAVFMMTDNVTIAGFILVDAAEGLEPLLYGEGAFTGGARPCEIGDALRVTLTLSAAE